MKYSARLNLKELFDCGDIIITDKNIISIYYNTLTSNYSIVFLDEGRILAESSELEDCLTYIEDRYSIIRVIPLDKVIIGE